MIGILKCKYKVIMIILVNFYYLFHEKFVQILPLFFKSKREVT